MTQKELLISVSVELESSKNWPWVMDAEDFVVNTLQCQNNAGLWNSQRQNSCSFVNFLPKDKNADRTPVLLLQVICSLIFSNP